MLLWNYHVYHKSPWKFLAWVGAICNNNWSKAGKNRAVYTETSIPKQWGVPVGYTTGWMLPQSSGYITAFSEIYLSQTGSAVMGRNLAGDIFLELLAAADLSLVVSSTGVCTITLTLNGDTVWSLLTSGNSQISLTATGTLGAVAFSTGESFVTLSAEADISALGFMTGSINPFTELSPEWLAKAVWAALASENNIAGTMGSKLNTASSGWIDMNALAEAVWEYWMRSLTDWWITLIEDIKKNTDLIPATL